MIHYYCERTTKLIPEDKKEQGLKGTLCCLIAETTEVVEDVTCPTCKKKLKFAQKVETLRIGRTLHERLTKVSEQFNMKIGTTVKRGLNRYIRVRELINFSNFEDKEALDYTITFRIRESMLERFENDSELRFAIAYHLDSCNFDDSNSLTNEPIL